MEKPNKLSLKEEIKRDVEQLEKEIENCPELDGIEVTEEMDKRFQDRLRAYENEHTEEETAREEIRRLNKNADKVVTYRKRKHPKLYIALVAIFVILLGTGMTSVGSKSYWKVLYEMLLGKEDIQIIEVDDMDRKDTDDGDEITAYKDIDNRLNISTVRLGYKPEEMFLERYAIDAEQSQAHLFYKYNDEIVKYTIYVNSADSSFGVKEEDEKVDEYEVKVNDVNILVEEYKIPEYSEYRQAADFEYHGVHYQLKGIMEKEKFKKIIENLYFL